MGKLQFLDTTLNDIQELKDIYTYYIENTTATFHIGDISDREMHDILFYDDSVYKSFVIKSNNETAGYVLLCPYKKREAYRRSAEVTIYLKPSFTSKGIGSKAIQFVEEFAMTKDIHTLLSVICGENTSSRKLFEKNGYEQCGQLNKVGVKFGRVLDIVIYQKEI